MEPAQNQSQGASSVLTEEQWNILDKQTVKAHMEADGYVSYGHPWKLPIDEIIYSSNIPYRITEEAMHEDAIRQYKRVVSIATDAGFGDFIPDPPPVNYYYYKTVVAD